MGRIYADYHRRIGGFETHEAALEWIARGSRVLDVGCATGYFARRLAEEKGCRVVGVEGDSHAAAEARSYCERVHVGDLAEGAFLEKIEERVDVVFFGDVIEHLADPSPLLDRAHAWLKSGGQVICSVPNVAYWKIRYELLRGRFDYQEIGILDRNHLRFYTRESFAKRLCETGYHVDGVRPICSDPQPLAFRVSDPERRPSHSAVMNFLLRRFPAWMATQFLFRARTAAAPRAPGAGGARRGP
jgi:methionine biosynthesis protein MetW